jgi:capsular exopolysaccharide synthesis family protein
VAKTPLQPDLRHYLKSVWRRKWIVIVVLVLIPAGAYFATSRVAKNYESSTTLLVRPTSLSSSLFGDVDVDISSTAEAARLIETTAVARRAAKKLGDSPGEGGALLGAIDAGFDGTQETDFLTITAQAEDPERAADVANAFAAAISNRRTQDAQNDIDETIETLTLQLGAGDAATRLELAQQLQELRALRASQTTTTQVVEPAGVPGDPISPNPRRNATIGFLLALLVSAGLVALLERLDRRLRNPDELEELVGVPLLGMVPDAAFPGRAPRPHVREAFQTLRAGLTYFNIDRTLASVIVASPTHQDGKTTVATNLAIALAQDERNVILVDGDLRRPQVAKRLGVEEQVNYGLDAVLVDRQSLANALVTIDVGGGRLRILPGASPPPNPSVLLGSQKMRTLLAELSERVDIVIIDTPPLLSVSDAIPLLDQVSGTVLVARLDHTSRDGLRRTRQLISTAGGHMLGVAATGSRGGQLYGYDGYGYGYGYETAVAANGTQDETAKRRIPLPGRRQARKRSKETAKRSD